MAKTCYFAKEGNKSNDARLLSKNPCCLSRLCVSFRAQCVAYLCEIDDLLWQVTHKEGLSTDTLMISCLCYS